MCAGLELRKNRKQYLPAKETRAGTVFSVLFFYNPAEILKQSGRNPAEIKPEGISCKNPAEIKSEGNPAGIRDDQSDTGMPPRSFQYASKASHSGLTQESALSR